MYWRSSSTHKSIIWRHFSPVPNENIFQGLKESSDATKSSSNTCKSSTLHMRVLKCIGDRSVLQVRSTFHRHAVEKLSISARVSWCIVRKSVWDRTLSNWWNFEFWFHFNLSTFPKLEARMKIGSQISVIAQKLSKSTSFERTFGKPSSILFCIAVLYSFPKTFVFFFCNFGKSFVSYKGIPAQQIKQGKAMFFQ